ncbi:MAG TPA: ATP synthase F1 subunit gamma [Candidatus Saccharimonadales bacterium]|nr:ATP synthase F1 subunit gamma [Candidatus Saccharimonadales bacterium]
MASTQLIKSRIRSVKNTRQITKAMQLVAASKMRKAQEAAGQTRYFSQTARALLTRLRQLVDVEQYDLYRTREVKARLTILITSDRGLAGAYDSNALKMYITGLKEDKTKGVKNYTIAIGRKGSHLASRLEEVEVVGAYHDFPPSPGANELQPIVSAAVQMFVEKTVDAVDIIYTQFKSTVVQQTQTMRILPAGFEEAEVTEQMRLAEFEPSEEAVLQNATLRLLEAQLLQTLLESFASEESMRMLAMKNATDNANELVDDLTLVFNNARQAAITQELAEITGGAEAMSE